MQKAVFLENDELKAIQSMNESFSKMKLALADADLQKHQIIQAIDELKAKFAVHEKALVDKYGADTVINIQTGEVTQKQ
jgi:hypothetical protein